MDIYILSYFLRKSYAYLSYSICNLFFFLTCYKQYSFREMFKENSLTRLSNSILNSSCLRVIRVSLDTCFLFPLLKLQHRLFSLESRLPARPAYKREVGAKLNSSAKCEVSAKRDRDKCSSLSYTFWRRAQCSEKFRS